MLPLLVSMQLAAPPPPAPPAEDVVQAGPVVLTQPMAESPRAATPLAEPPPPVPPPPVPPPPPDGAAPAEPPPPGAPAEPPEPGATGGPSEGEPPPEGELVVPPGQAPPPGPPPAGAGPYGPPPGPHGYPYPKPHYGYSGYPEAPPPPPPPPPPEPEPDVEWFFRFQIALGPPGFSENNELLRMSGYSGIKSWLLLDGAYMLHKHIGVGGFAGLNFRSASSDDQRSYYYTEGPSLNELALFVGAEAPILIVGSRAIALMATPRVGYAAGSIEFDYSEAADFQHTVLFGGALNVQSFEYHVGGSVGYLAAPTEAPGGVGRSHDYGGLLIAFGGTIDG